MLCQATPHIQRCPTSSCRSRSALTALCDADPAVAVLAGKEGNPVFLLRRVREGPGSSPGPLATVTPVPIGRSTRRARSGNLRGLRESQNYPCASRSRHMGSKEMVTVRAPTILRLPLVIALAIASTLAAFALSSAASAATARVTCTSVAGVGVKGDPAIVSGCTNAAKTGGKGKLVDVEPRNTNDSIWTITWAGKHGTTIIRINQAGVDKQNRCPKGWFAGWEGGKVTGGTGPAHTIIPNGRTIKVHICGKPNTNFGQLAKGTKLVL